MIGVCMRALCGVPPKPPFIKSLTADLLLEPAFIRGRSQEACYLLQLVVRTARDLHIKWHVQLSEPTYLGT